MLSHTATHTHTHRNSLLSLYHSYYGTIKNMMASYLQPFPSTKQSKLSQVSHVHLDLIWLPLFKLWSSTPSSSTLHLSSHLSLSSLCLSPNFGHSLILLCNNLLSRPPRWTSLTAIPSLSSHVFFSHLVIPLHFLPSVLVHSVWPSSQPPHSLSTHLPRFIQSLLTNNQAFPPGSSGQRSPPTLLTHPQPNPTTSKRTNKAG